MNNSVYINDCNNHAKKKNFKKNFLGLNCRRKLYRNVKNMSFSYQNKKKLIKYFVVRVNSFVIGILINGFLIVIAFFDLKCFLYNIANDKFV